MNPKEQVLGVYDQWYAKNRPVIEKGEWRLVEKRILEHPGEDELRGLNLLCFLPPLVNERINGGLIPELADVVSSAGWFATDRARHITILDILPHNCGLGLEEIKARQGSYVMSIDKVIQNFSLPVAIELKGVFASPDGITVQGYPVGEGLSRLRKELREGLAETGLVNLEQKKYVIETAHVALVKFINPLEGGRLLQVVDKLRRIPLGCFQVEEMVLNVSSRYDKVQTIEVVKKYRLGAEKR